MKGIAMPMKYFERHRQIDKKVFYISG